MISEPTVITRDSLRLSGPDTISLLQGLVTTNMDRLPVGASQYSALLSPQGKILDCFFLVRTEEETVYIDAAPHRGEGLVRKLSLYRMRAKVDIENVSDEISIGVGPAPENAIAVGPDPRLASMPSRWIATKSDVMHPNGDETYNHCEIDASLPAFGIAFVEGETFPLNVNLDAMEGIDHHKGCFVGQEVASRMYRKGEIRKRTWHAYGDGLEKGVSISVGGRAVGEISAAHSTSGLALIRTDRLAEGDEVTASLSGGNSIELKKPEYLP